MDTKASIALLLAAGAAALLTLQGTGVVTYAGDGDDGGDDGTGDSGGLIDWLSGGSGNDSGTDAGSGDMGSNCGAFLYMLRMGESSNQYNVINGGAHFSDYSRHPDKVVPPGTTTAAGAYQFVFGTWTIYRLKLGLPDFSPASQDRAAVAYLTALGAMPYINTGDVAGACAQINRKGIVWESLAVRSQSQLQAWYQGAGGILV